MSSKKDDKQGEIRFHFWKDKDLVDFIEGRITKEEYNNRKGIKSRVISGKTFFCGNKKRYNQKIAALKRYNTHYEEVFSGSFVTVNHGGMSYRYSLLEELNVIDSTSARACADVIRCAKKFMENNRIPNYDKAAFQFNNQKLTAEYVLSGKRDVVSVDISHCYWKIAFNTGIIDEKVYERYKDEKIARLVAIGNCNKDTTYQYKDENDEIQNVVKQNDLKWVWEYITYKAYEVINTAFKACRGQMFAYQTDGVYIPPKSLGKVVEVFTKQGFEFKIKDYKISRVSSAKSLSGDEIQGRGHYIVLVDSEGNEKRANLGMSEAIKRELAK